MSPDYLKMRWLAWSCILMLCCRAGIGSEIFMATMGGTKSHKIPFWELAKGLIARNHNVTFVSPFPADFHMPGLEEITPAGLVFFVRNYTNWDLVGARMKGEEPVSPYDVMRYPLESCDAFLDDPETHELLASPKNRFDLFIIDGAYPECILGFHPHFDVPFMFINTVGFYTGSLSNSGSPAPYSVTPVFAKAFRDDMDFVNRLLNSMWHIIIEGAHYFTVEYPLLNILRKHLGPNVISPYEYSRNVSFILQNGHHSVTYPRPYLPNVAEIACIHCKPAKPLSKDLEDFIQQGGDSGFIFVSMGSSVKAANMPEELRRLFVRTFARLPYQVLWKWEDELKTMSDLSSNVMLSKWLPQQDLLGHRKIRAFVTHGGLLSMFETVYHGVPVVTMPVFCDHESNAAKAAIDGYALKLDLQDLTSENLFDSITAVIHEPKYRENVKKRQYLLKDQKETPLEKAVYWTEYVIRHKGAKHLLSPAKDLNVFQYYALDVFATLLVIFLLFVGLLGWLLRTGLRYLKDHYTISRKSKFE